MNPPCLVYEDEHLLVANKPPGLNTHAPSPYAGEGLYDWLRNREPRWANLAIVHRLDKETSGLIVFPKTALANRSLTEQFTRRSIHKKYLFLTDRPVCGIKASIQSAIVRAGDKYVSRPAAAGADFAETRFRVVAETPGQLAQPGSLIEAQPLTGRTHQIRVHAAQQGLPILGDTRYGGTPAKRLCLHSAAIKLVHPATGKSLTFQAAPDFAADPALALRQGLLNPESDSAHRLIHGAADGWPGWYVDRLGDYLLSQAAQPLAEEQAECLRRLLQSLNAQAAYHKVLAPNPGRDPTEGSGVQLVVGSPAADCFYIRENGLLFELRFDEGYSVGLFLDQRDNRRRLLTGHIARGFPLFQPRSAQRQPEILNAFAYTCGFSLCAATAGARATSVDLSKKYLEWGQRNFQVNQVNPAAHEFLFGDAFGWFRRLHKKGRLFDVVVLDPPTFSRSKESGAFRAEKDYQRLVGAVLPLLRASGVLFASSNTAGWPTEQFLGSIQQAVRAAQRPVLRQHYCPQPPDFPGATAEPPYLKTVWLRVG